MCYKTLLVPHEDDPQWQSPNCFSLGNSQEEVIFLSLAFLGEI